MTVKLEYVRHLGANLQYLQKNAVTLEMLQLILWFDKQAMIVNVSKAYYIVICVSIMIINMLS